MSASRHSHSSSSGSEESWKLLHPTTTTTDRLKSPPRTLVGTWLFSRIRALTRRRRRGPSPRRRRSRGTWTSILCFIVLFTPLAIILLVVLTPILNPSYSHPPAHYNDLVERCRGFVPGCANPRGEKVFIASVVRDGRVVDGKWGERVLELVTLLGEENVFVSVYGDGGGGEEGRKALEGFRGRIGSRGLIVVGDEDEGGMGGFENVSVMVPDGTRRVKWTGWEAEGRNRVLRPLDRFGGEGGVGFVVDKVLFLDEVAFEPVEAAQLLFSTNVGGDGRARYLAACALGFEGMFELEGGSGGVLRDGLGYASGQRIFPYFGARPGGVFSSSPRSSAREEILGESDAVGVKSCWSGMVAVKGEYLQNVEAGRDSYEFVDKYVVDVHGKPPKRPKKPVRFRYEPGAYYDADEGCLFAADLADVMSSEMEGEGDTSSVSLSSQIFVNPYVRVSTHESVLSRLGTAKKFERLLIPIFTVRSWFRSGPSAPYVHVQHGDYFDEEIWDGDRWRVIEGRRGRAGMFCGRRGMRVLKTDGETGKGVELKIPPGWDIVERRKKWYRRRWDWWWPSLLGGEEKEKELPKDWRRVWEDLGRGDRTEFWQVGGG